MSYQLLPSEGKVAIFQFWHIQVLICAAYFVYICPAGTSEYIWTESCHAHIWTHYVHMYAMHIYVCHVHVFVGHVNMHTMCYALYCHVLKWVQRPQDLHITTSMATCRCYMSRILHMHIIGVAASQSILCWFSCSTGTMWSVEWLSTRSYALIMQGTLMHTRI